MRHSCTTGSCKGSCKRVLRASRYGGQPSRLLARHGLPTEAATAARVWRRVSQLVEVHLRAPRYGGQPSRLLARHGLPTKAASVASVWRRLAEREGFEPPEPF